jgi:hypothetical protein
VVWQAHESAVTALLEFANACAVYSRFDLHQMVLSELAPAVRDSSLKTRFLEVSLAGICESLIQNLSKAKESIYSKLRKGLDYVSQLTTAKPNSKEHLDSLITAVCVSDSLTRKYRFKRFHACRQGAP